MSKAIKCPSCGCEIKPKWNEKDVFCQVCGNWINVEQQVNAEKMADTVHISVIKYEADTDAFVWKHPVQNFTYGTQLVVHESQEAIFFKDGRALDKQYSSAIISDNISRNRCGVSKGSGTKRDHVCEIQPIY